MHRMFIEELDGICAAALLNPLFDPQRLTFSNYRQTWFRGVRLLSRISDSELSKDLEDIFAFLCVCKALSQTLDFHTLSDFTPRFLGDLQIWSSLLHGPDLQIFKSAVHNFWGVDLDMEVRPSLFFDLGINLVQYAQGLVSSLVHAAGYIIEPSNAGLNGLKQSQLRWLERHGTAIPALNTLEPENSIPPDDAPELDSAYSERKIYDDIALMEPTSTEKLLMASAAVMVVIIFLICK